MMPSGLTESAPCGMVEAIEELCGGSPWALITGTALSLAPGIVSRVVRVFSLDDGV